MVSCVPLAIGAWLLAGCIVRPAPPAGSIDSLQRLDALDRPWLGIQHPLEISFDEHLIPSIHAGSEADAAYGLGLVHAHLRIVQMELFRRISQRRISESAGPFANGIDHVIRAIDLGRAVPEIGLQLPPETRPWLAILGSSYRFIDEPWPSSTTIVNKSAHTVTSDRHQTFFGADARLLIDIADLDANRVVLLGGQDGRVGSTAIIDQLSLWRDGRFIPLPLSREGQVSRAKRIVRVEPASNANPDRATTSHRTEANP